MQFKKLIFVFVILAFLSPVKAHGGEIDVEAGDVKIRTEQDGQISVDTGSNRVELTEQEQDRRSTPWWQPWNYFNRHRSSSNCTSSTYQRSTQTTTTNGHTEESSVSTSTCR
ncbi:conserved exported hypothetical protein [Hyella patelloides LEGE 07179]|uniref:Uncharacterized protein n=1 Tax=Hyella patelloides LEGE 07179 TaxID=945734 RepID=A0A563VVD9_9CYAN|nr:hypothetical protein [Hyella patelloides]VEP15371.1 conserved exported hypothetical protein [Hyella patelloides LEGE 07179]